MDVKDGLSGKPALIGQTMPEKLLFNPQVSMSPDGRWIAMSDGNNTKLWRKDKLQAEPRLLEGHTGAIMSSQFSPDSKWLLTASKDNTARLWPLEQDEKPKVLSGGHTGGLTYASFDPDGKWVATASSDHTVHLWEVSSGQELGTLQTHGAGVNEVHFSPDGNWVLSVSDDGSVQLNQCEACFLPIDSLKERVDKFAKLPEDELKKIKNEITERRRYLEFMSWLSAKF